MFIPSVILKPETIYGLPLLSIYNSVIKNNRNDKN